MPATPREARRLPIARPPPTTTTNDNDESNDDITHLATPANAFAPQPAVAEPVDEVAAHADDDAHVNSFGGVEPPGAMAWRG